MWVQTGMPSVPSRRRSPSFADQRIHVLADRVSRDDSDNAVMLLDRDLRIRGVNPAYEAISLRDRESLTGQFVFEVFPDDPDDPGSGGPSQLAASVESAMRRRGTDDMPIMRYDITDPRNPDVFLPKLWRCSNTSADDDFTVIHRVSPITSLADALAGLALNLANGEVVSAAEQLRVLSALSDANRAEQDQLRAMSAENAQLQRALETRDMIGQAKGMLMERFHVDAAAAFKLLTRLSQESNVRLAEIARRLVELDQPAKATPDRAPIVDDLARKRVS
jgi:PAS domain-containing protein